MKYRMLKRLLAALLCACLLVTSLPLQALAAVDVTKGNSAQENAQLLQQLEALTGGESEAAAALDTMRDLGLVDENGNLLQTRTVTLDGQEMFHHPGCHLRGRHHGNHVQPANRVRPHPAGRDRRLQSDQERPGDRR